LGEHVQHAHYLGVLDLHGRHFLAHTGQALFGFVAAGGTIGGIVGPALAASLVKQVGNKT
jgi:hypothetical protein